MLKHEKIPKYAAFASIEVVLYYSFCTFRVCGQHLENNLKLACIQCNFRLVLFECNMPLPHTIDYIQNSSRFLQHTHTRIQCRSHNTSCNTDLNMC